MKYSIERLIAKLEKETGVSNRFMLLKHWGEAIVDECSENIYMSNINPDKGNKDRNQDGYLDMEGEVVYPILNTEKVKNQIK